MVTNNKVLTVSYGTFSCTLEGFDDSFDTMKAIAEYFRDLAADDRYFGAEPPTPDAEMLARIAEREVERRVQARTEHGAIVLTTQEPVAHQETPTEEVAEDAVQADEVAAVETVAEDVAEDDVQEAESEPVDVTDSVLQAMAAEPDVEVEDVAEDEAEEPAIAEDLEDEVVAADEPAEDELVEISFDDDTETPADPEVAESDPAPEAEDSEIVLLDDVSVVEDDDSADIEDAELVEIAEQDDASDDEMIVDILEASEEDAPDAQAPEEQDEVAEVVDPAPQQDAEADSIAAKLQRIRAVVSKSRSEPDADDFSEDEHAEPLVSEVPKDPDPVLTLDDEMAAAAAAMDAEVVEEAAEDISEKPTVKPVRARVIRMKKADLEAAVDTGLLEAEAVEDDEDEDDQGSSSLSAEEEAELLAELAQVEAELNGEIDDDEPVEAIAADIDEEPLRSGRGRHLTDASAQNDPDMTRLMQEADTQMEEPDGSRRRQAIAHLRAAVAATKAEKKAGMDTREPRDVTEVYRDDLASVVGPSDKKGPRKAKSQPPLKLVAEQRVDDEDEATQVTDMPEETQRAPVRPRRVSAADRNERADAAPVGQNAGNFAEFAESVGAHALPEVLEAAAAYLTFVEKMDVFSRPMIVRMAQGMGGDTFSREDSLRGFGQLLRENKITKVSGGRFTASDENDYRPRDRAAG